MCGLFGFSGADNYNVIDIKTLFLLSNSRGKDGSGYATRNGVIKTVLSARSNVKRKIPIDNLIIGHTRGRSTGKISRDNTHPFEYGDLIGTHNGYIQNFYQMKRKYDLDYEVDSQLIWYLFGELGYKEALAKLDGSMALAWLDKEKRLNLYRHRKPLWIGYKEGLFYASEKEFLQIIECEEIKEIDRNIRYIIEDGEIIEELDYTECVPKIGKVGQNTQSHTGCFPRGINTPNNAHFIKATEPGIGFYYWFELHNKNILNIQLASVANAYPPAHETYNLQVARDVERLSRRFPDIFTINKINHKIPADYK